MGTWFGNYAHENDLTIVVNSRMSQEQFKGPKQLMQLNAK